MMSDRSKGVELDLERAVSFLRGIGNKTTTAKKEAPHSSDKRHPSPTTRSPSRHPSEKQPMATAPPPRPPITPDTDPFEAVIMEVASSYKLERTDILGTTRGRRHVAEARQVVMYLLCTFLGFSYPKAGKALRRDHSTILHGYRIVEKKRAADEEVRTCLEEFERRLAPLANVKKRSPD